MICIFLALQCPNGYTELVSNSDNCYKIVEDTVAGNRMSWERAKDNCEDDNAVLACFSTQNERDELSQMCHDINNGYGCWVGYKWLDGKLMSRISIRIARFFPSFQFSLFNILHCHLSKDGISHFHQLEERVVPVVRITL